MNLSCLSSWKTVLFEVRLEKIGALFREQLSEYHCSASGVVSESIGNQKEHIGRRSFVCGRYIQQHGNCLGVARKAVRCHGVV
jgi:hypothetical protein